MDERDIVEAAHAYYVLDETMEGIAHRLGVSRSTVSRLLKEARRQGVVQITVDTEPRSTTTIQHHLDRFGVTGHIVDLRSSATPLSRLDAVARSAGNLVTSLMHDGAGLGIAWGTTISAVVDKLPAKPLRGATVVQLNGAASAATSGIAYAGDILTRAARAYDAHPQHFPVPAFFDYAETREALWREKSVRRVHEMHRGLDVAVFSTGSFTSELPSHVYSSQYLSRDDVAELLRADVVGDVCTVFLREDGSYADIAINDRASGPTPADLQRLPRRICVVTGVAKVPAALGALRSGAVTDLVLDDLTAAALVRRLERPARVNR